MEHICIDVGSDRCPCVLMESGQCYTCNMIKMGKCNCGSLWQGMCPYTEYIQRRKTAMIESVPKTFVIHKIKSYSPTLTVITLEVPLPYGIKCKEIGAFLMVKWLNWFIPISVLNVELDYEEQLGYVELAVNATGPKTIGLLKTSIPGLSMIVKGPFYSGILGKNKFRPKNQSIIVAKGIAVMPIINMKSYFGTGMADFNLDTSKLPEEFLDRYLSDMEFEKIDLEADAFDVSENIKEKYGYALAVNDEAPNLFFMVSPYYIEKLLRLTSFSGSKIIRPNHSNMCCGEGLCGSCSYTDGEGMTVKSCKCID